MTRATDSDLMTRVGENQLGLLGELFERHHRTLYRFCLRMTGNRQASEDLVQDIFMRMLKHRSSFKPNTSFSPWMYRIARNACVDYLRRSSRAPDAMDPVEEPVDDQLSTDERFTKQEQAGLIRQALMQLPVDRREVLLLSRYEFKSYEEIANSLGVSVGTVKVRAHRAIKQLRRVYHDLAREASP